MKTHFFTILVRRLLHDKLFAAINLLNLVVGFSAFILLSLFIQFNLNYDRHNDKYDRIYRLQLFMDVPQSNIKHTSSVTAALGRQNLPSLPEVEQTAVVHNAGDDNIDGYYFSIDKKNVILLNTGYYSDPSIFNIFTFHFTEGNPEDALAEPNTVVLSESNALKFFPQGQAVGKILYLENKIPVKVSGVYQDLPLNSDWRPEFLLPMASYSSITGWNGFEENYYMYSFQTYVLLKPNASYTEVNTKIYDALKDYRKQHHPYLRPLSKVHLNPFFQGEWLIALSLFSFTALLILTLSAVNFINLQTADASSRGREIGIKKTVGFSVKELWSQYVGEAVVITLFSAILGLAVAHYCLPVFERVIGKDLGLSLFHNIPLILMILGVAVLTGFLSSLYPAFIISRFNPVKALKQKFMQIEKNGFSLKKGLVTVQFSISLFLVIVSLIVFKQADYMMNKDMGFDRNDLLVANIKTYRQGSFEPVRQQLLDHPEITDACFSDYIPFILPGGDEMNWEGGFPDDKVFVRISYITWDFFDTYKMKIVEGRSFSRDYPADQGKCLVNEAAVKVFGWKNPVGMKLKSWDKDWEVIGVVGDYVSQSVQNPIDPHTYRLLGDSVSLTGMYSVRYRPGEIKAAKRIIRDTFEENYPADAFNFEPFDDLIVNEAANQGYKMFSNIWFLFTVISIIISTIGLFGLVIFYSRRKMKEIGIRKVIGFSVIRLYGKLTWEFMRLIIWGMLFSWVAAWYVYKALPGADKYGLGIGEFLLGTILIFAVALLTISYNIWIAARRNPSAILKYE